MNIQNKKGFTLVELIIVIAIIGILAGVLFPTITGYLENAKESAALQEAAGYETAYETWLVEVEAGSKLTFGAYVVSIDMLDGDKVNTTGTTQGNLKLEPLTIKKEGETDNTSYTNGFILKTENERIVEAKIVDGKLKLTVTKPA